MSNTPTNNDDIIDSRDIIARIADLQTQKDAYDDAARELAEKQEALDELLQADDEGTHDPTEAHDADYEEPAELTKAREEVEEAQEELDRAIYLWEEDDEQAEYKALTEFAEECEGYCDDWRHGATLVRETYWERYAQEFADDIGAIDDKRCAHWPYTCIDWERAAEELRQDYTSADFDGVTYYVR